MRIRKLTRILGPGLLYAGAAIGVSHLVQSTRAGANYGFELLLVLILANIIKYPFFEFGPRYAAATGNNLITGYRYIGKWALVLFAFLTVSTLFAIQAAVTIVAAGLVSNIFHLSIDDITLSGIILLIIMIILMVGKYAMLDKLIKYVIVILAISTIAAVINAFVHGYQPDPTFINHFQFSRTTDILFLIAFIGWMPAPIDVSVWHSLWSVAKKEYLVQNLTLKQSLVDFKIGYWGTAFLAICFLALGALVMYGTGDHLSPKGVVFAGQLINLYTSKMGDWAYPVIAIAAMATMFSTTMTCLDAYPWVLTETFFPKLKRGHKENPFRILMIVVVVGTIILLKYFSGSMRFMVDMATTISFVTAPVLAFLNYKVVTHPHVPAGSQPGKGLRILSWIGIIFLGLFCLIYLVWRFII